jgi:hypothetical protein
LQPLIREFIDFGSRFVGYRDEAATLRGAVLTFLVFFVCFCIAFAFSLTLFLSESLRRAEERADDLESQLRASEEARKKAEKDASCIEDLRLRLKAAEDALSDKEVKQV